MRESEDELHKKTETENEIHQRLTESEEKSCQMIQNLEQRLKDESQKLQQQIKDKDEEYQKLKQSQQTVEKLVQGMKDETRRLRPQMLGLPMEFKVENTNDSIFLPPFCTHPYGYQMCIHVDPNGHGSGKGTHVSIFTYLMLGPFDDNLKWPFRGVITIQMRNQAKNCHHVEKTISYDERTPDAASRVMGAMRSERGRGHSQFLSHDALVAKEIQFLRNNHITIQIMKVVLA